MISISDNPENIIMLDPRDFSQWAWSDYELGIIKQCKRLGISKYKFLACIGGPAIQFEDGKDATAFQLFAVGVNE